MTCSKFTQVKFLKSKEGCAMVQMGDSASVERAIASLNKVSFFGHEMQLGFSKQAFLNDVKQPFDLPDGSCSFKDYMGNRNNRFTNPESALKNRISHTADVLHFFNAPYGIQEQDIINIFDEYCPNNKPVSVKFFQSKSKNFGKSNSSHPFPRLSQVTLTVSIALFLLSLSFPFPQILL